MFEVKYNLKDVNPKDIVNSQLKRKKSLIVCFEVIFIIFALFFFICYLGEKSIYDLVMAILFLIFTIAYVPFVQWLSKTLQKKINSTAMPFREGSEVYLKFEEESFYMETTAFNYKETLQTPYSYIFSVVETNNSLLLYSGENMVFAFINKNNFVVGNYEDFKKFIISLNLAGKKIVLKTN